VIGGAVRMIEKGHRMQMQLRAILANAFVLLVAVGATGGLLLAKALGAECG
jgi:hypothetical protein